MQYWVYLILGVFIAVTLYFTGVFSPKPSTTLPAGPFGLSKAPQVASTDEAQKFMSGNTGSFQAFFHLLPFQRTGETTVCNNRPGGDPNCTTDRYDICKCEGTNCSPCLHKGYFNLLSIGNVVRLEVLAAPDAGRQNQAQTQLVVRTTKMPTGQSTPEINEETFALPAVPFQTWVGVTVAREGRRFDVYFNDALVVSKRSQYSLDTSATATPIVAGDTRLFGQVSLPERLNERLSASDVSRLYKSKTDTNGMPRLPMVGEDILKKLNPCPEGNCLKAITVRPANPLYTWDTQYD